jgi:hypothetical protein
VIVYDLDVPSITVREPKTNAPGAIHGHRPLTFAIALKLMQPDRFKHRHRAPKEGGGGQNRKYAGAADDPEITKRVETFKDLKADIRSRRKLVSMLVRSLSSKA